MTDEERLIELKEKRKEYRKSIDEINRLNQVRNQMSDIHNLLSSEISALEKRIAIQNEIAAVKEGKG